MHIVCPSCLATNRVPAEKLSSNPTCGKCKNALFNGTPVEATDQSFSKWIGSSEVPVIVDCWASWCGPCQQFAPTFTKAAATLEPHFRLVKLDTEKNPSTATTLGIRSIPTLIAFSGGKEVDRLSGALPESQFIQWVQRFKN